MTPSAAGAPSTPAPAATEAQLERMVYDTCKATGWRVAHFRAARTAHGWRTPVAGDGAGFPDFCLVHPRGGVLFVELKTAKGRLTLEQSAWGEALIAAGSAWQLVRGYVGTADLCQQLADRTAR